MKRPRSIVAPIVMLACLVVAHGFAGDDGSWTLAWETRLAEADRLAIAGADAEATRVFEETLSIARRRAPGSLPEARSIDALAEHHLRHGRAAQAEPLFVQSVERMEILLGPNQPRLATSIYNLGVTYFLLERYVEADRALTRAVAIWEDTLGPDHPEIADAMLVRKDIGARIAARRVSDAAVRSDSSAAKGADRRRP